MKNLTGVIIVLVVLVLLGLGINSLFKSGYKAPDNSGGNLDIKPVDYDEFEEEYKDCKKC